MDFPRPADQKERLGHQLPATLLLSEADASGLDQIMDSFSTTPPSSHKAVRRMLTEDRSSPPNLNPKTSRRKNWTKRPPFPEFQLTLDADHGMNMLQIGKRKQFADTGQERIIPRKRPKMRSHSLDHLASNTRPPESTHLVCGIVHLRPVLFRILFAWEAVEKFVCVQFE